MSKITCRRCGTSNFYEQSRCINCGSRLHRRESSSRSSSSQSSRSSSRSHSSRSLHASPHSLRSSNSFRSHQLQSGGSSYSRGSIESHMPLSILTTICCCLPLGIAAIIYSAKVDTFIAQGNWQMAQDSSDKAKFFSILGIVLGGIFTLLYAIFVLTVQLSSHTGQF